MSQAAKWNEVPATSDRDRKALGVEKLGVIGGFLVGLPAGLELVREPLLAAGAPSGVTGVATVAAVALCTWVGLRVGSALASKTH
ncbi:MAG: hypothetical protein HZB72_13360 [Burkholderiales bacterium]|nr:hypothetical protein [Burkholderiales bacterium]MCH2240430.1 hypothetical protein [Aquabacterium sp.]